MEKHKILRINCPGYGQESFLSANCARPLYEYQAIVVNPLSVLHLFDKDPELLKQVEEIESEGLSTFQAKSDRMLESLNQDLETRSAELVKFLDQGGLLIYFLCRAFNVESPNQNMDNYSWLDILAPDRPRGKNERHMSSVVPGKYIELNEHDHPFAHYLRQPELEWTTIIRNENLTDGYTVLASAGPRKCIAASLNAGNGCVLFLPAPYRNRFDDALINCIEDWQARNKLRQPAHEDAAEPAESTRQAPDAVACQTEPAAEHTPGKPAGGESVKTKAASKPGRSPGKSYGSDVIPQAKDLIEKMESVSRNARPSWCEAFSFAELDHLRGELQDLDQTIKQAQERIAGVQNRLNSLETVKNALIQADGDELHQAVGKVFNELGWTVSPGDKPGIFWLMDGDRIEAILKVVRTASKPQSSDLADLAESIISYWSRHESEPKGILVASTYADQPPGQRTEEDYSAAMIAFAQKKNLCLLTCLQLLSIYCRLESSSEAQEIRQKLLAQSGYMADFKLEPQLSGY